MKRCDTCNRNTPKPCNGQDQGCKHLIAKRDSERAERESYAKQMKDSDSWPRWPVLPVKRSGGHGMPDLGIMVAGKGPIVYHIGLYELQPGQLWDSISRECYESVEALVAAGWRVD